MLGITTRAPCSLSDRHRFGSPARRRVEHGRQPPKRADERSLDGLLGGFGAMTAVLLLVFKDTILSVVASIQIASNDMIRIGDWVEMPKYGADGDVVEIDIPARSIKLAIDAEELAARRAAMEAAGLDLLGLSDVIAARHMNLPEGTLESGGDEIAVNLRALLRDGDTDPATVDAVTVASAFKERVDLTGIVLTRVDGDAAELDDDSSDAYFETRPRDSRLAAWASPQSEVIASRAELEAATEAVAVRYPDALPLPPFWGGYRLDPRSIEFWQGRASRLHDRLKYERGGDGWTRQRLYP